MESKINDLFYHLDEDIPEVTDSVENSLEIVQSGPVIFALNLVAKLVGDDSAVSTIYGDLARMFDENLTASDILAVMDDVRKKGISIVTQDDAATYKSYMQCLPIPNTRVTLSRPIIFLNEKYTKKTKEECRQIYLLVCKLLREIGHLLTPGLLLRIPGYIPEEGKFSTPYKVGQNILPGNQIAPDCGAAVEEIAYGGRLRTWDNSARPFRNQLKLIVRPFLSVPPGPGNYVVYAVDDNYVKNKVADLRGYLSSDDADFPGLLLSPEARSKFIEGHQAQSAEAAMRRIVGEKAKRSARNIGADATDENEDPEYEALVQCGVALSQEEVIALSKGYKV